MKLLNLYQPTPITENELELWFNKDHRLSQKHQFKKYIMKNRVCKKHIYICKEQERKYPII